MKTYQTLSDLELVDLLKKDDQQAYAEIYHRYTAILAGFASARLFDLDDARDIIHDIFVKLWENRQLLKIDHHLKAYLFTLVRYRIVDKIRQNITKEAYADMMLDLAITYANATEQELMAKELQQSIQKTLNELSPRVREVYILSREQNRSIAEIANHLHISEQTVKNQLSVALKHLRQSLTAISLPVLLYWLNK